jgi:hypothetical protein
MNKGIAIFTLILFCCLTGEGLHYIKGGFSPRRIQSLDVDLTEGWNEETQRTINQTFYFVGRGRQCFAFQSQDGKYILKIPRTDIYKTPFWVRALPIRSYRAQLEARHEAKKQFILESFRISFYELKNQTGLLAIHLGSSPKSGRTITLVDASGWKHNMQLDKLPFLLQYKKPILIDSFLQALKTGNQNEAGKILDALVAAITERASKGILNLDRRFIDNYGYDGEKAFQIDVGSFFKKPDLTLPDAREKSLRDSIDPVKEWLTELYPEMLNYLDLSINKKSNYI